MRISGIKKLYAGAVTGVVMCGTVNAEESKPNDQSLLIEAITVVTSKVDTRTIGGAVSFLDTEYLQQSDYGDIHRILARVPGVQVQDEDGFGLRPNIGLRGTGLDRSSKITVMEDGVLMAPAPYASPSAYYFPQAARFSAIEVTKGPAAIKYGPFTTGGSINLISTPVPSDASTAVEALFGSDDFAQVHAAGGKSFDLSEDLQFGFLAEGLLWKSDGFKNLDSGGDTGFDIEDYVGKAQLVSKAIDGVKQILQFKYHYSDEISNETYLGLTDADFAASPNRRYSGSQKDTMTNKHEGYSVTYKAEFDNGVIANIVAYRNEFARDWFKLDKVDGVKIGSLLSDPVTNATAYRIVRGGAGFISADNALAVKHNNRSYVSKGIQASIVVPFESNTVSHEVTASIRYHEDAMDRFQWVDKFRMDNDTMVLTSAGIPGTDSNRIDSADAISGYVQDKIEFDKWVVTPGIRFESVDNNRTDWGKANPPRIGNPSKDIDNSVSEILPGLTVGYQTSDTTFVFAGLHRGFAPPGPGSSTKDNESSWNYEVGARFIDGDGYIEGIGFFTDYSNILGSCTASSGGNCNIGDTFSGSGVHVYGLEATAGLDLGVRSGASISIPVDISYTLTSAKFQSSFQSGYGPWGTVLKGDRLPYVPSSQLALSLGLVDEKWSIRGVLSHVAKTRSKAGQGTIVETQKIDSRTVVDLAGTLAINEFAEALLRIENLFDDSYSVARRPAGLRPGKPFTLKAGIRLSL